MAMASEDRSVLSDMRTVVLWNPSAGSADVADDVREELAELPHVTILEPQGRDEAIEETIRAARDGASLVVAAGGDGTVNSVVAGLMQLEKRPAMGLLPLGSGNDLARSLEIPLEPAEALETLFSQAKRPLDVVEVTSSGGTRTYVNMLTGGNSGRYLHHMTPEIKKLWGPFCYLRGVIDVLRDLQVYQVELACDDDPPERFEALNIFVANGRFSGGGLPVSPPAELDDGYVDIVVVRDGDAGDIAALTSQYVLADYLEHEMIEFRRARQLKITADPPLPLTADGDEIGEPPLSVSVLPNVLQVVVPDRREIE